MHKYLRAIGFSKIKTRQQFEYIYKDMIHNPDHTSLASTGLGSSTIQYDKNCGKCVGLSIVGESDLTNEIIFEHFFPVVRPVQYMRKDECRVEKHCYNESYDGIIEDIGMSVVFYVTNIADYNRYKWYKKQESVQGVFLSALSNEGKILLPLAQSPESAHSYEKDLEENFKLLEKAKKGDQNAADDLVLKSALDKTNAEHRALSEDVFTIVKSSLIPYGIECEDYELVGTIMEVFVDKNIYTDEEIYVLLIQANEFLINVAINKQDLVGIPMKGRRFRGIIWLQGYLNVGMHE